ncbi:hypothetical protein PHET_06256 [Paragonimus heterotremus]|uniref:Uncharacterized protein n=1 Tax=Paragonimus heterotremus TaxID=100268 RepID=A0A8J4T028_9TREM|nr:hypothetical protein PHET_06256 [Paragonimus heterotremus]
MWQIFAIGMRDAVVSKQPTNKQRAPDRKINADHPNDSVGAVILETLTKTPGSKRIRWGDTAAHTDAKTIARAVVAHWIFLLGAPRQLNCGLCSHVKSLLLQVRQIPGIGKIRIIVDSVFTTTGGLDKQTSGYFSC